MNKQIKESIVAGMGIGFPVTLLCMTLIGGMNEVIAEFMVWLVASALYGLLSRIYDKESLSLPLAMAIHMGGCLVITLATCWLLGYAEFGGNFFLAIGPVFLVIYLKGNWLRSRISEG